MQRIESIAAKATLNDYAAGAFQQNTRAVGEFLAPTVLTPAPVGLFKRWSEKSRFRIPKTARAVNGRATQISLDGKDESYNCQPNALDFPIDRAVTGREGLVDGSDDLLARDGIGLLSDIYGLAHLYESVTKAKAAAGAGVDNNCQAAADLVEAIDEEIEAVLLAGKCEEAGVLFGAKAWRYFKNHPSVVARKTVLAWDQNPALFTANARYMGCFAVIDTTPEGQDPVMDFLLKEEVIIFGRHPAPNRRDPSFMKTFRHQKYVETVRIEASKDGRHYIVRLDWNSEIQVTNPTAVKRLNFLQNW